MPIPIEMLLIDILIHQLGMGFFLSQLHFTAFEQTLSAADLREPVVSALVAAKLRDFHGINIPGDRNVLLWDRMR